MKKVARLMLACGAAISVLPSYAQVEGPGPSAETAGQGEQPGTGSDTAVALPTAQSPGRSSRLVEEITVSAQRREENLQVVPISVQAFSGEKLEALGVKTIEDLPALTPGLVLQNKAGYSVIFLRGVGTDAFLPSADPNVPVYIDGIPQLSGQGAANVLGRVERVEVLKGPQGTLFGRNSTGGAISLTTPDPGDEFVGDVGVEFGDFDMFNTNFFLDMPFNDEFGVILSGYSNRSDSYYVNVAGPLIDTFKRGVRGKMVWNATDTLKLSAFGFYGEQSEPLSLTTKLTRPAPILSAGGVLLPKDPTERDRGVAHDLAGGNALSNYTYGGNVDWSFDSFDFKALFSDQQLLISFAQWDFDSTDRPLVTFYTDNQFGDQQTAELQILSNEGTPFSEYFSFVAGAFYITGDGGFPSLQLQVGGDNGLGDLPLAILGQPNFIQNFTNPLNSLLDQVGLSPIPGVTGPVTLTAGGILTTESLAGYFQGTLNLQSTFDLDTPINLTMGVRVDRQTRGLKNGRLGVILPPGDPRSDDINGQTQLLRFPVPDVSATQVPLRLALNWFPSDDMQLYTAFSRGFTSPTYNTINFFTPPDQVKASRVDSYEVGAKMQLLDRTLTLNTAAFYINQFDILTAFLSITSGGVVRFDNAQRANIYGAEFDAVWQVMPEVNPGLALVIGATYLESEYVKYTNGRGFDVNTGLSFGPGSVGPERDFSGNAVVNAPDLSASVGVNQLVDFDNSSVEFALNAYFNSGYFNTPQQEDIYSTDAYALVDSYATWMLPEWGIALTGFVKNIFDEDFTSSLYAADFGVLETLNPPRTYGVRIKMTF